MLKISVKGKTDVGKVRSNNEDAFIAQKIWNEQYWLLVVIDGLGGYAGGEIAASIAKKEILSFVESHKRGDCMDVIMQAVTHANNEIYNERKEQPEYKDMGCVITAAILDKNKSQISVAHVGDTRLYMCYNHELTKLTHDHSFVGFLEDSAKISEEEAMAHPRRNIIDRIVGDEIKNVESDDFIEAAIFPLSKGMKFLLCSDGLSDLLKSKEIQFIIESAQSIQERTDQLITEANLKSGKDNITAIIVDIEEEIGNAKSVRHETNKKKKKRKKKNRKQKDLTNDVDMSTPNAISRFALYIIIFSLITLILIILYFTRWQ